MGLVGDLSPVKVHELFTFSGLRGAGPVPWGTPVPEEAPGVYVVATVSDPDAAHPTVPTSHLPASLKAHWLEEPVVYIGQALQPIRKRINQFYQHKHGRRGPHSGGQDILLILSVCPLWVYWSPTGGNEPRCSRHSASIRKNCARSVIVKVATNCGNVHHAPRALPHVR
jgi:hypothetical protein